MTSRAAPRSRIRAPSSALNTTGRSQWSNRFSVASMPASDVGSKVHTTSSSLDARGVENATGRCTSWSRKVSVCSCGRPGMTRRLPSASTLMREPFTHQASASQNRPTRHAGWPGRRRVTMAASVARCSGENPTMPRHRVGAAAGLGLATFMLSTGACVTLCELVRSRLSEISDPWRFNGFSVADFPIKMAKSHREKVISCYE